MKKILVIGALRAETDELISSLKELTIKKIGVFDVSAGTYGGVEILVCCCGVGKVHAAAVASAVLTVEQSIDFVINIGVAGGISLKTHQGDIVIAEMCVQHDFDSTADGKRLGQIEGFDSEFFCSDGIALARMKAAVKSIKKPYHVGIIASGDQFINSKVKANAINFNFNAIACDMESAAIAQVCSIYKVPFLAMRAISDNGDDVALKSFYEFLEEAAKNSTAAILAFASNKY